MRSKTKVGQLKLYLKKTQSLLKCSFCSKTVQGPSKVLPCKHLACTKCYGECCGKRVTRKTKNLPCRTDVQEFAKRFSGLLKAYDTERKKKKRNPELTRSKKIHEAATSDGVVPITNGRARKLGRNNEKEKRIAAEDLHKVDRLAFADVVEPVEDLHNVPGSDMQREDLVESPMDLSTPVRPRSTPTRKSFSRLSSSSSWMPLDLSGKPALVPQTCSGLDTRMFKRHFVPDRVYSSDFGVIGMPQSRVVVSSPFIPQMDNPREESGVAKRKVVETESLESMEQQERKKTKMQTGPRVAGLQVMKPEMPMEVEDAAELADEPQQAIEPNVITNGTPVEISSGKNGNGTVVRTDDDWNNDEEISLMSPSKLQSTATTRPNEEAANTASSDPFAEDLDFCFLTPEAKGSKDGNTGLVKESPQQVKQTSNVKTTPSRSSAVTKTLEQVRTRLSLDGSFPKATEKEIENNVGNHEESICNEDFPEFFSCSSTSEPPVSSKKASTPVKVNRHQNEETPSGKQMNPKNNFSPSVSKTPAKKVALQQFGMAATLNRAQRKSLVLCPTRLTRYQTARLESFASTFGAKITRNYTDDVTHVIFTFEKGSIPQTMKYLMAIAGKKWVLECRWIEECLKENRIVSEELYEATSTDDPGARLSRMSKLPLFPGLRFYVYGSFTYSGASAKEWMTLIRTLGGQIEEDVSQLASDVLVIGDSNDDIAVYGDLYENYQAVTIAWEWVLACTIKYNLEPVTPNYCISPKTESAEELAALLPGFLLDIEDEKSVP